MDASGEGGEDDCIGAALAGDSGALGKLLETYRPRLRRMIALRMDARLAGRVDPADVLQEAFAEIVRRLPEFRRDPTRDFFLWVRFLTGQKLLQLHRKHLGAQRDARREVPEASSFSIASAIFDAAGTPSREAMQREVHRGVQQALQRMRPVDREVLVLRHFEHLSNGETAQLLELSQAAATQRYVRALKRLGEILKEWNIRSATLSAQRDP